MDPTSNRAAVLSNELGRLHMHSHSHFPGRIDRIDATFVDYSERSHHFWAATEAPKDDDLGDLYNLVVTAFTFKARDKENFLAGLNQLLIPSTVVPESVPIAHAWNDLSAPPLKLPNLPESVNIIREHPFSFGYGGALDDPRSCITLGEDSSYYLPMLQRSAEDPLWIGDCIMDVLLSRAALERLIPNVTTQSETQYFYFPETDYFTIHHRLSTAEGPIEHSRFFAALDRNAIRRTTLSSGVRTESLHELAVLDFYEPRFLSEFEHADFLLTLEGRIWPNKHGHTQWSVDAVVQVDGRIPIRYMYEFDVGEDLSQPRVRKTISLDAMLARVRAVQPKIFGSQQQIGSTELRSVIEAQIESLAPKLLSAFERGRDPQHVAALTRLIEDRFALGIRRG